MTWKHRHDDGIMYSHPDDSICPEDRGEFGMPTIGGGHVRSIRDSKDLVDWSVVIEPSGMQVGFSDGKGYTVPANTADAKYIMEVLPEIIQRFLVKNTQYARAQTGHDLGIKGIIPDINRKGSALITRFWDRDGLPMEGEDDSEELIDDMIGHLLLMRAKLRTR